MKRLLFLFLAMLLSNIANAVTITSAEDFLNVQRGSTCYVEKQINFHGKQVELNKDLVLVFRGGCFVNGIIVGNETRILGNENIFKDIEIRGSWLVPSISSSMFCDLSAIDAIKNVMALSNSNIKNTIVINPGVYRVSTEGVRPKIEIKSNTTIILNGNIILEPNNKTAYSILSLTGRNITIKGTGSIIGDFDNHLGVAGEWGMGIFIDNAHCITISGITIENCWGDCIYINNQSSDIKIKYCNLSNSRRQGISIISANDVTIKDCRINNIGGTSPGLAIDIEPNKNDVVDNIQIDKVIAKDCEAGVSASNQADGSKVGAISITNSQFYGTKKNYSIVINGANKAVVKNCYIDSGTECGLWFTKVLSASATNNTFVTTNKKTISRNWCLKVSERRNTIKKIGN